MGWFWRIVGCVFGASVAVVYAFLARFIVTESALALLQSVHRVARSAAAHDLSNFLTDSIGPLLAGYLLFILLAYLLHVTLAAFNSSNPSPILPALFLIVAAAVVVITAGRVLDAIRLHPLEALVAVVSAGWFVLGHGILVAIGYFFAATLAPPRGSDNGGESRWRGYVIGINFALNVLFAMTSYAILLQPLFQNRAADVALFVAAWIGFANLTAPWASTSLNLLMPGAIATAAQFMIEAILGWTTWLMPMSWVVTGVGAAFYFLSWLGHCLIAVVSGGLPGLLPWLAPGNYPVVRASINWPTGTMILDGGVVGNSTLGGNPPSFSAAGSSFNMGCFVFCHSIADQATHEHETGHGLSLAAFGGLFHYIGAIDENLFRYGAERNAYAERVAESNVVVPDATRPAVTVWT